MRTVRRVRPAVRGAPAGPRPRLRRPRAWARRCLRLVQRLALRLMPRVVEQVVWRSPLFDAEWYLKKNPDVIASGMRPERHYRRHGVAEGRDPNAFFDTSWYLAQNPDVDPRRINPLDHYHLYGANAGRDPSFHFDSVWYLVQNPDVRDAGMDPLLHYLRFGAAERRAIRSSRRRRLGSGPRPTAYASMPANPRRGRPPQRSTSIPAERPLVLMIDVSFPRPDHDAGSVLMGHYVRLFRELGYYVHFASTFRGDEGRYAEQLRSEGVTTHAVGGERWALRGLLEDLGEGVDVVFLSRVSVAGEHLDDLLFYCREARLIFMTHDLHHVRVGREARLGGDRTGLYVAAGLRELEIHVARLCHATIVVTDLERQLLEAAAPGANIHVCPLMQAVVGSSRTFDERSGVAFIGSYRHAPNVDAVRHFLDDVWPAVHAALPAATFYAIGADLPPELCDRDDPGFVPVGHAAELVPWLERVRLTVAPLRFGAGMKGKVLTSLAHGVPCVASPVAAEGIGSAGGGVAVAAEDTFAAEVIRVHEDAPGWRTRSEAGMRWIDETVSLDRGRAFLRDLLADIGAPLLEAASEELGAMSAEAVDGRK